MLKSFKDFLRDEGGNVTIESLVVIGGSVWMAGVLISDITFATMVVSERLNTRLEYTSIVEDILGGYGTEEQQAKYSDPEVSDETDETDYADDSDDTEDEVDCVGNPGNNKCVGNAGENPNGSDDWGSGSNGQGDVNGNATNGNSNGNGNGNNGGGNGNGENDTDTDSSSDDTDSSPGNSGNAPGKNKDK